MWLGNMIASETGELVGLVDFGRAAMAPADAELDTLLRFWRTPWLFVPEEWESRYRNGLDHGLLSGIIADCTAGLSAEEAALVRCCRLLRCCSPWRCSQLWAHRWRASLVADS